MKLHCLLFSCLSLIAAAETTVPEKAQPALTGACLTLSVVQNSVQTGSNAVKINELVVNIKKIGGPTHGAVTIKAYFVGRSAETSALVLNSVGTQEAEAVAGGGNTYTFQSQTFNYTPGKAANGNNKEVKGKAANGMSKEVKGKGIQSQGWVVRVYQKDKLLVTACSSQGYDGLIDREASKFTPTDSPTGKAPEKIPAK